MKKKVSLSDFENSSPKEIKSFLGVDDRRMEQEMRRQMDGAGKQDYQRLMDKMYDRQKQERR